MEEVDITGLAERAPWYPLLGEPFIQAKQPSTRTAMLT